MKPAFSRRGTLLALASIPLFGALGACSSDDGLGSSSGNDDVATGGERFGTADEETARLGSDAEPGTFPRTVVHATGSTEIAAKPTRVVVLDTGELDAVITLGLTPVGIPSTEGANSIPSYLADKVDGITTIGTIQELNLEAIAALEPDLILGSQLRAEKLYPQLSAIAPTVFAIRPGFPWKENFLLVGDALGMDTEATAALNAYADAVGQLKDSVTGDPTISLVRFMPGRIRLYGNLSLIGVILGDAGLSRPQIQDIEELAVEISPENLAEADGDILFWTSYGTPEGTDEHTVITSTVWQNIPAVQQQKAFRVDDDIWFLGLGPTGAGLIVGQLGEHLAAVGG